MLSLTTDAYYLYATSKTAQLRRAHGWAWQRRVAAVQQWDCLPGQPLAWPDGVDPVPQGAALHVLAGSAFCRFLRVELPPGVRDEEEARMIVRAQMRAELALDDEGWRYTYSGAQPAVVGCAIADSLYQGVQQLASSRRLRLRSVRPFFAAVWNARQHADGTLVLVEEDAHTLAALKAGQVASIGGFSHGASDADDVRRAVRRQLLGRDSQGGAVQVAGVVQARDDAAGLQVDFLDLVQDLEGWV